MYTEKCRFMGKEVREISRFFVAPPRVFTPAVCALTHLLITQKYPHLSTFAKRPPAYTT